MHLFTLPRGIQCLQVSCVVVMAISIMLASFQLLAQNHGKNRPVKYPTCHRTIQVDGLSIFYMRAMGLQEILIQHDSGEACLVS
jgi:hypothetical protein